MKDDSERDSNTGDDEKITLDASKFDTKSLSDTSLVVLTTIAVLVVLRISREVFIPITLGVLLAYALAPPVNFLVRRKVPRVLAAAALVFAFLAGLASATFWLADDAIALVESAPAAAQEIRRNVQAARAAKGNRPSPLERVKEAASELEAAASDATGIVEKEDPSVTKVEVQKPEFDVQTGLATLGKLVSNFVVILFIAFFLLASGGTFRRKVVKVAGDSLALKKVTVQALNSIDRGIQRYLLVQVVTSAFVGIATWLAFLALGMERAAVWGLAAFALNFIPYLGPLIVTVLSSMIAFVQFGSLEKAILVGLVATIIGALEGNLLSPILTGRAGRLNPVAVFVAVLVWGWLWGAWGFFLAVPIIMVVKVSCERIEGLQWVAEFLGE